MDRAYPLGEQVIRASVSDWPNKMVAGNRVIVHNWRGGMVDVLCRQVVEDGGRFYLTPYSIDPHLTERLPWDAPTPIEGTGHQQMDLTSWRSP